MDADYVVRNGLVVDGTGGEPYRADVAISDGVIVNLDRGLRGRRVIDASGCLVAPGFIDVHTHYDPQVTWDPWLTPSSWLGVTSAIAGNCGFSLVPCRPELRELMIDTLEAVEDMPSSSMRQGIPWKFESYPEYLEYISARGLGINFGGYIGHTALRLWVMGSDAYERQATSVEIEMMRSVVMDAIKGGALGFSTDRAGFLQGAGGRPVPSVVASREETDMLCSAVAEAGRGIVHVAPGNNMDNVAWIYDMAARLGITVTWSAILQFPDEAGISVTWRDKLGYHVDHRHVGDLHPQVTSRKLVFGWSLRNPLVLYRIPAFAELERDNDQRRMAAFRDDQWRSVARRQSLDAGRNAGSNIDWSRITILESSQPEVSGVRLTELAQRSGCHPLDVLLDVALADNLETRVTVEVANLEPAAVTTMLLTDGCILGLSDAGAHTSQICDAVLPVHFLSEWVRDRELMSIADGIRKTSGEIAEVFGFPDRGTLEVGKAADIVVLDWQALGTGPIRMVDDLPGHGERLVADRVQGLKDVLVNGVPIRSEFEPVQPDRLPGVVLPPKAYESALASR
jgi:N-acyl-D-aspartate/D-glutamate deacylase